MLRQIDRVLTRLFHRHEMELVVRGDVMQLRCISCDHTSPGWSVPQVRPNRVDMLDETVYGFGRVVH